MLSCWLASRLTRRRVAGLEREWNRSSTSKHQCSLWRLGHSRCAAPPTRARVNGHRRLPVTALFGRAIAFQASSRFRDMRSLLAHSKHVCDTGRTTKKNERNDFAICACAAVDAKKLL